MDIIEKLTFKQIRKRQIRMMASTISNQLNISQDENHLVFVIGSGIEMNNLEAIQYWLDSNLHSTVIENPNSLIEEFTCDLEKILMSTFDQWI